MIYDIIGDLHGHADELRELLHRLGYIERHGAYSADGRRAVFVGDFIDRGPKIRETLQIVRAMVSRDAAEAVIGNHEFNALCFHTGDGEGGFLRPHSGKNTDQHSQTLRQLAKPYSDEWQSYLSWFKDLPNFLEFDGLRVVHAAWDEAAIRAVRGRSFHDAKFLSDAGTKGTPEAVAIEILLKGHEIPLPEGEICRDKDGTERSEMRVRWWRSQSEAHTYLAVAVPGAQKNPGFAHVRTDRCRVALLPRSRSPGCLRPLLAAARCSSSAQRQCRLRRLQRREAWRISRGILVERRKAAETRPLHTGATSNQHAVSRDHRVAGTIMASTIPHSETFSAECFGELSLSAFRFFTRFEERAFRCQPQVNASVVSLDEWAGLVSGDVLPIPVLRSVESRSDIYAWFVRAVRRVSSGELLLRKHGVAESDDIDREWHKP